MLAAARVAETGASLDVVADSAIRYSARVRLVGTVGIVSTAWSQAVVFRTWLAGPPTG